VLTTASQDPLYNPAAAAATIGIPPSPYSSLPEPATPQSSAALARSVSNAACSEGSAASASQSLANASQLGEPYMRYDEAGMTPVFEPNVFVPQWITATLKY
jgi:hypothetical protein